MRSQTEHGDLPDSVVCSAADAHVGTTRTTAGYRYQIMGQSETEDETGGIMGAQAILPAA